ncbi:hypothetical protein WN55_01458 [Dufourea novaeangliae]|uniref:Uncharacterized protein n=1 Tax=Dufourea novaeangliae TaxID=178035 RepID=A0A154PET2_DUFNO|nr:hypothetical protein WN55_01458 [Dufourea novaeangliae]
MHPASDTGRIREICIEGVPLPVPADYAMQNEQEKRASSVRGPDSPLSSDLALDKPRPIPSPRNLDMIRNRDLTSSVSELTVPEHCGPKIIAVGNSEHDQQKVHLSPFCFTWVSTPVTKPECFTDCCRQIHPLYGEKAGLLGYCDPVGNAENFPPAPNIVVEGGRIEFVRPSQDGTTTPRRNTMSRGSQTFNDESEKSDPAKRTNWSPKRSECPGYDSILQSVSPTGPSISTCR